jgi:putative ABC transport system permease protein
MQFSPRFKYLIASVKTSNLPLLINTVEDQWKAIIKETPFEYSFLDDDFQKTYEADQRLSQIITCFTIITIFVACLGLFALAAYMAEQRRKEIGIRKVLGATVTGIVALLSNDFLKLVVLAILIASPIAWWTMNEWLQDFAYRVSISWWIFLTTALIAMMIALSTVVFQAMKAAIANPVKSLRTE